MKKILRLLVIVVGVVFLVSGQSQGEYSLTQFSEGTANYQSISIKITDKFMSVRGGCNIHTGYFNVTDNTKVGIGPFSSTLMACEKDFDTPLINKLTTASSFTTSQSGVLTLLDKDKKVIAKLTKLATSEEKIDINSIIAQLKGQTTTNTTQNQTGANTTEGTKTNQVSPQNVSNQSKSEPSQVNIQPSFSAPASKKLSLEGTFKPNNVNLDSDLLIVFEDIETVSISNGCNMHSGFYSAFENGTVKFGEFFSTTRVCKVDFDKTYLDALKQSDSFTKKGKDLSLNSGSKLSLSLAWQLPQSPALPSETNNSQTTIPESPKQVDPVKQQIPARIVPTIPQTSKNNQSVSGNAEKNNSASSNETIKTNATTGVDKTVDIVQTATTPSVPEKIPSIPEKAAAQVFLTGEYTTDISLDQDLRVKFENGSVSILNGCNSHSAQYKAYDNESIWFGGFRSTRKACANDRDSIYLEALSSSVSWRRIGNQILLKQISGASTMVLIPYVLRGSAVTFNGKYLTNMVKISNLQIEFNGSRLSISNGCNIHSTDYTANSLGQFSISTFTSTKRQCIIDYDSIYLSSLSASSKFQSNSDNSQIILKNSNGETTIILTLFVPAKPVTLSGTFVTDIKVTPSIQIKFLDSSVSIFGGCNTWTSTYQAFDNKTISFLSFGSSNLLCKNDFDKIYVDALKNAVTYTKNNNNEITLFDLSNKKTIGLSVAPLAKQVTFEGNYTTSIPNDPDFLVRFSGSQVSLLNGCNSFSGSYEADSLGNIVFRQFAGTLKACSVDNDGLYTRALTNSVSYETNGSKIILRDSKKEETMVLSLLRADFVKLSGKYSTNLPDDSDLLVEFTESTVSILNGCNAQSATYQAFSNASISFTPFISTLKFCAIDYDSKYTLALGSSQSFVQNSNSQIILKNGSGITTLVLSPFVAKPQPKAVSFNNTYKPNLNDDSDLLIKLDNGNKVSIVNGCNVQSGTYEAYDDGSIKFSQFMSTRMFCPNDKDSVYTTALTSSTKYQVQGEGNILLQNSNNQQTILLSPYTAPKQEAKRVYLGVGNYTTNIKEDSDLVISIGSERINLLNGCNTYGADYKAYSNGSIQVGDFIGTEKACRLDFDYLYLNALSDSSIFSESSNSIVLKDDYNQTTLILSLNNNSTSNPKPATNTSSISTTSNTNNNNNNNSNGESNIKSSRSQSSNASNNASRTAEVISKGSNGNTAPQVIKQADSLSKTEETSAKPQAASEKSYDPTDVKVYYSITPALKIFEGYFIISEKDPYLGEIMSYLEQDYYYFLKEYEIVGGFRKFRGDSLDYQIVFKSLFGTFNAVLEYRPSNARRILLKSLALLDFSALLPTYEGCESKDLTNRNCITCLKGYRNFRGRCFLLDDKCLSYVADQCFKCKTTLFQGTCRL